MIANGGQTIAGGNYIIDAGQTRIDAIETAKSLGYPHIEYSHTQSYTPQKFDKMNVRNHRARLNATIEEIFPPTDRPRGIADIKSVRYAQTHKTAPIALLKDRGWTVLDGVHRIVAAYLNNMPIIADIYIPS